MMLTDINYTDDISNNNLNTELRNYETFKEKNGNSNMMLNMESINTSLRIIEVRVEFVQIGEVDTMNEKFQGIVKVKCNHLDSFFFKCSNNLKKKIQTKKQNGMKTRF
jgi:hypothetical protein